MLLLISEVFDSFIKAAVLGEDNGQGLDLKIIRANMKDLLCHLQTLGLIISPSLFKKSFILCAHPIPRPHPPPQDRSVDSGPRWQPAQQEPRLAGFLHGIRLQNYRSTDHLLRGTEVLVSKAPSLCRVPAKHEQMFLIFLLSTDEIGQKSSPLERGVPKRGGPATNMCSPQGRGVRARQASGERPRVSLQTDLGLPAGTGHRRYLLRPKQQSDGGWKPGSFCCAGVGRDGARQ